MARFEQVTQGITSPGRTALTDAIVGGAVGTIAFSGVLRDAHALGMPGFSVSRMLGSEVVPSAASGEVTGLIHGVLTGIGLGALRRHAGFMGFSGRRDPRAFRSAALPIVWLGGNMLYGAVVGSTFTLAEAGGVQQPQIEEAGSAREEEAA